MYEDPKPLLVKVTALLQSPNVVWDGMEDHAEILVDNLRTKTETPSPDGKPQRKLANVLHHLEQMQRAIAKKNRDGALRSAQLAVADLQ